jgi:hypothetical protein
MWHFVFQHFFFVPCPGPISSDQTVRTTNKRTLFDQPTGMLDIIKGYAQGHGFLCVEEESSSRITLDCGA